MESKALVKSTNNIVPVGFLIVHILRIVKICEVVDLTLAKQF